MISIHEQTKSGIDNNCQYFGRSTDILDSWCKGGLEGGKEAHGTSVRDYYNVVDWH